jgi:cobalt-zinc-cadmium efflux system outer membrane protein
MKDFRIHFALLILLCMVPLQARSMDRQQGPEQLQSLVDTALSVNPELKASESRWRMFAAKARQASAFEDPMLMLKAQNMPANDPFAFNKDSQSAKVIGISQQVPFWGKRELRKRVALSEAESYRWAYEERKLELARMVKETVYRLWAVDRQLEKIEESLNVLGDIARWSGLKYSVGQGTQQELHKAGLERSKMVEMQIALQQQRKSLQANLNYLLYRPQDTPVPAMIGFSLPKMSMTAEKLEAVAFERRPQLRSLASLVEKGEAQRRLARKESYPDFTLSFEYMIRRPVSSEMGVDPGNNMYSASVSFNLPVWSVKRQAMVAESMAESSMSTDEFNALKNEISLKIRQNLAELDRLGRTIDLYSNGVILQASQMLESAMIAYRVNKTDFGAVLDARMTLLNNQRQLYDMQADYLIKLAELEAVTGQELLRPTDAALNDKR